MDPPCSEGAFDPVPSGLRPGQPNTKSVGTCLQIQVFGLCIVPLSSIVLLTDNFELLNPLTAGFSNVDIPLGVHCDAVRRIELAREVSSAAETR